jgi:Mg2+ and Co2+ transporter CorA
MATLSHPNPVHSKSALPAKPDSKIRWRELVYLLLPDGFMVFLAILLVPVILVPLFFDLSSSLLSFFQFLDYLILGIFILEYGLKTALAPNVIKHIINPWHLLDLAIIVIPVVGLLPFAAASFSIHSPLLRLIRIVRLVAVGGRTVDRRIHMISSADYEAAGHKPPMQITVIDGNLNATPVSIGVDKITGYIKNTSNTWIDITSIADHDLDSLSASLGIPRLILESELQDESYPRVDYFENYSMIFTRIVDFKITDGNNVRLQVHRTGQLIICAGQNIITLSLSKTETLSKILEKARKLHAADDSSVVIILYSILKHILEKNKQVIAALERQIIDMENIPIKKRPSTFLETTFYLRKEVNTLVPGLLHLKEVLSIINDRRVPLAGYNDQHAKVFDILLDEAGYQYETATSARDNLLSLIDLYINTTSYEMNKVMRIIAVFTSMSILPAILGLFGSNITGNPWDIHLWQLFAGLGCIMLIMFWVFYRLGWLKG